MNTVDLFQLHGKIALITGGGRGLGQYCAEALVDAGATVVLCSRNLAACEEVQKEIEARGGTALALACDITQKEDVERVTAHTINQFGKIDILVNNSGFSWGAPPEDMPLEKFQAVLDVNLKGTFLMSQAVGKTMIERGQGGTIINVASIAGLTAGKPPIFQAIGYNTSKAAVIHLTRDLAVSWASHHITVNAIAPGWFPTRMSRALLKRYEQEMLADIPLVRFGKPEDLKGAFLFLASPAAAYMTGQTLVIDGGITAK
jgi:gluconate 5-dehydrogenase